MQRTQITAGLTGSSPAAQWSDLPDDLLGMVRLRVTFPRDRVRLAAVCRMWRAATSRLPAPPAVPLLLLSPRRNRRMTHLCGPDESWVIRVPDKAADRSFVGSYDGGWVAAVDIHGLILLNLFSGAEVPIPSLSLGCQNQDPIDKIIFSDAPTSSNCILAAITHDWLNIAVYKVDCRTGWITQGWEKKPFGDITFCNGDLYGVMFPHEELVMFKIGMKEDNTPVITSAHQLAIQRRNNPPVKDIMVAYDCYISELHGKPLMAVRTLWLPNREPFFKVFKLVDAYTGEAYHQKWTEVTNLGNYALFLGPKTSKAVCVPLGTERHGLERNHIYYSQITCSREKNLRGDEVYSVASKTDNCMYCRKDQSMGDGIARTGYYMIGWNHACMWLYPPAL